MTPPILKPTYDQKPETFLSLSTPKSNNIPLGCAGWAYTTVQWTPPMCGLYTAILFLCDKHAMFTTCPCTRPGYARFTVKMLVYI